MNTYDDDSCSMCGLPSDIAAECPLMSNVATFGSVAFPGVKVTVAFWPEDGRCGVALNGPAVWHDAGSMAEALAIAHTLDTVEEG